MGARLFRAGFKGGAQGERADCLAPLKDLGLELHHLLSRRRVLADMHLLNRKGDIIMQTFMLT